MSSLTLKCVPPRRQITPAAVWKHPELSGFPLSERVANNNGPPAGLNIKEKH